MDKSQVAEWVAAYERAWRSAGTAALPSIFTPDASYQQGPYEPVLTGLPAIETMWEAERDGPSEVFRMTSEVVALDGSVAIVRANVWYGDPVHQEYRDLWLIRFAADGRCESFEEWPFWPEQRPAAGR